MALSKSRIEDTKSNAISLIVKAICQERGYNSEIVLNEFMKSKTYKLLMDTKTGLYLESYNLLLDLYKAEINNNELEFNWLLDPRT